MKKIISVLLLLTILLLADQNSTDHLEQNNSNSNIQNYFEEIQILKNENRLLKAANSELKINLENLKVIDEKKVDTHEKSIVKTLEDNPVILSWLITILIVSGGTWLSLRQVNIKTKESINVFEKTLEQQKELKQKEIIANNRQKWINDLRIEVSKYIRIIYNLHHLKLQQTTEKDETKKLTYAGRQLEAYQDITEVETKIALFLNPKEKKHAEIYSNMINYKNLIFNEYSSDKKYFDQYIAYMNTITNLTREIIKEEWEKIKE